MKRLGFASIALSMLLLAGCGMQSAPEMQSTLQDQISLYCLDQCVSRERFLMRQAKDEKAEFCRRMRL